MHPRTPWRIIALTTGILGSMVVGFVAWNMVHRQNAPDPYATARLRINGQSLFVEVPGTAETQALGLGGRERLGADRGMMWVYDPPKMVAFWMKGMKIPLDFLWIRDGQVIGVTADVQPPTSLSDQLTFLRPPADVDRVVEVNAGYAAAHNIIVSTPISQFDY